MSAAVGARAETLFLELIELPPESWPAILDARCGSDLALRLEVESLLGCHRDAGSFLDRQELLALTPELVRAAEPELPPGTRIGEYTLDRVIGAGGMGVVYVARQERPRRTVALKLVNPSIASPSLLRRFEHEAEMLGRLQHPGIAQIFEAGSASTDTGVPRRPFISMELVNGPPLIDYAKQQGLTTTERLELIIKVCDAVQHAHQRGVIHRDLKPANVLVDENGQPKVLDFGVARVVGVDLHMTTIQTAVGQLVGTLPYMSPEQVLADPKEVDTRSDVYALGVVLFEILTGKHPLELGNRSIPDSVQAIRNEDPARLSSINRLYRGDLETIVGKALEKDKSRRYQSAADLGDDLRRFLSGEPINAKVDSAFYIIRRQLKRHRGAASAGLLFLVGLIAFTIYATVQSHYNRELAASERAARVDADSARDLATARSEELRRNLYVSAIGFAQAALAAHDIERVRRVLDACPEDLRGWEWRYLRSTVDMSDRVVTPPANGDARAAWSRDGSRMITWLGTDPVRLHDGRTGEFLRSYDVGAENITTCAMDPEGRSCWIGTFTEVLIHLDLETGEYRVHHMDASPIISPMAVWPGGQRALVRLRPESPGESLEIIDAADGARSVLIKDRRIDAVRISHDGSRICVSDTDGTLRLLDESGTQFGVFTLPGKRPSRSVRFSPDDQWIASGRHDGQLLLWRPADGASRLFPKFENKVLAVAWSPDGRHLAISGTEAVILIIDVLTGSTRATLFGHETTVDTLEWFGDTDTIASWSRDRTVRWWFDPLTKVQPFTSTECIIIAGCWAPEGRSIYLGLDDGRIIECDAEDLRVLRTVATIKSIINEMVISPDGLLLAACDESGQAAVLERATGRVISTFHSEKGRGIDLAFDPSGARISYGTDSDQVSIHDSRTGEILLKLPAQGTPGARMVWTKDGSSLFVCYDTRIILHDGRTGEVRKALLGPTLWVSQLVLSDDGERLFAASADGGVYEWRWKTGDDPVVLLGHKHAVHALSLSPDGTRMVTGGWDNTVRIWDRATGVEMLMMRPHTGAVWVAQFSPDGSRLMSASTDGTVAIRIAPDMRALAKRFHDFSASDRPGAVPAVGRQAR